MALRQIIFDFLYTNIEGSVFADIYIYWRRTDPPPEHVVIDTLRSDQLSRTLDGLRMAGEVLPKLSALVNPQGIQYRLSPAKWLAMTAERQ